MDQRTDQLTAMYINAVIAFCQPDYRHCAIVTLLDYGLPMHTVLRVLDGPRDRRPDPGLCQQESALSEDRPPEPARQLVIRD
jgi:hypothetical protein